MKVGRGATVLLALLLPGTAAILNVGAKVNPITKVVTLLTEMKAAVEKDAMEDDEAFDKFACWCTTNKKTMMEAVAVADRRITALESSIEEAFGLQAQHKNEIASLEKDIVQDQDALNEAASVRMKDAASYQDVSKDAKECIAGLREAVGILSKVQLMQRKGRTLDSEQVRPLLLQFRGVVRNIHGRLGQFRSVMQQDLWDVVGSLDRVAGGGSFMPRSLSTLERRGQLKLHQPLAGAAAGAKSYNSQSGQIVGILQTLLDDFEKGLASGQRLELDSIVQYHKLRSSKQDEISAAIAQKKSKDQALNNLLAQAAKDKEELETTKAALFGDQQFLAELRSNCEENDKQHAARKQVQGEEIRALSEVIKLLTEDDARDLFSKTISFVQVGAVGQAVGQGASAVDSAQHQAAGRAMRHIMRLARKHKNWVLASLAVRVQLDAFTKVKEVLDKMVVDLKEQQQAEVEKKDFCNKQIDETEDNLKVKENQKEDLEGTKLKLENLIATLEADLDSLKTEVANMHVSVKKAGEDRKAQDIAFQQAISDQRAAVQMLKTAEERLRQFYSSGAFAELTAAAKAVQVPGALVPPPPPKPEDYSKNAASGGVLQVLAKIIGDAEQDEVELVAEEQHAQATYAKLANAAAQTVAANDAAIVEKTKLVQQATAEKSETQAALLVNSEELTKLDSMLEAMHIDCDWLQKHFSTRQQARQEEIESIQEAKAILSGASFGKEDDA